MSALRPRLGTLAAAFGALVLIAVARERAFARSQARFDRVYGSG